MHVGIAYPRWRGKRSRHSRRMRTRNFTYLARGPCGKQLQKIYIVWIFLFRTRGEVWNEMNIFLACSTVFPKKYAHGFVVLCFFVVMQSFIMNSHEVFIHIHQGCFAGTGAIVRLPQCQWSKPVGYGKISQCITTTKHSKAKTVCIFLWIYCRSQFTRWWAKGRFITHAHAHFKYIDNTRYASLSSFPRLIRSYMSLDERKKYWS